MAPRLLLLTHSPGLTATRGAKQAPGVRLHMLDDYSTANLARTIRDGLRKIGYRKDEVLIREFSPGRLKQMMETGTDRSTDSTDYNTTGRGDFPGWDAKPQTRANEKIGSGELTFANRLRWRQKDMPVVFGGLDPNSGWAENNKTTFDELVQLGPTGKPKPPRHARALAFYNSDAITRAPGAEVEYWFKGNPRDALLMVIAPSKTYWERIGTEPELMQLYKDRGQLG